MGGGLVNFPTRYLKEVELEGEGGENDGGGSGSNDELILKTKQIIADYATDKFRYEETPYTTDNVEFPDAYIYFDTNNKILYDCSSETSFLGDGITIPVYLNSRNITENSIVCNIDKEFKLSKRLQIISLNDYVSEAPEGTVNKISFNVNDYFVFDSART